MKWELARKIHSPDQLNRLSFGHKSPHSLLVILMHGFQCLKCQQQKHQTTKESEFYREKNFSFTWEMSLLKPKKPGFHSDNSTNHGSRKREEKERNKTHQMVVASSAAAVNTLWMDTLEQGIKIKILCNYLSNIPSKDLDSAVSP